MNEQVVGGYHCQMDQPEYQESGEVRNNHCTGSIMLCTA